jgi:hypothetical protein
VGNGCQLSQAAFEAGIAAFQAGDHAAARHFARALRADRNTPKHISMRAASLSTRGASARRSSISSTLAGSTRAAPNTISTQA